MESDFGNAVVMNERKLHIRQFASNHQARGNPRQRHAPWLWRPERYARHADSLPARTPYRAGWRTAHSSDEPLSAPAPSVGEATNGIELWDKLTGGSTHEESPECTPASSTCPMTPPITTSVPSANASTSISVAFSRNWSISTGRAPGPSAPLARPILHRVHVVCDYHGSPTKHIAGANQHRQSDFSRHSRGFFRNKAVPLRGCGFSVRRAGGRSGDDLPQGRWTPARCR